MARLMSCLLGGGVASLMLASGQSRRVALLSSATLGGATLLGVGLMYALHGSVDIALPFSAGVTVYVAASDLSCPVPTSCDGGHSAPPCAARTAARLIAGARGP